MSAAAEDTPHLVATSGPGGKVCWDKRPGLDMSYATNRNSVLVSYPLSDEEYKLSIDELVAKYPGKVATND